MLAAARNNVARAAHRFDAAVALVEQQGNGLRASVRRTTPALFLGSGLALGLLVILLPRRLRQTVLFGSASLLLRHVWPGGGRP